MAKGCGCGCNGQKTTTLTRTSQGLGRVRPGLSRGGLSRGGLGQLEMREPWLTVGPEGVAVAGRQFGWQAVGGFIMQGALLYLLWTTIRHGPEAVQTERERRAKAN